MTAEGERPYRQQVGRDPLIFSLEQFFRLGFRVGMMVVDTDGRALGVNQEACRLFRRPPEELLSESIHSRISHPDDLAAEEPLLRELLAGERDRYALRKRFRRSDGLTFDALLNVELLRDEQGQPRKAVGAVIERERLDALRDLFEQRRLLAEALADADAQLALAALRITEEEGVTRRQLAEDLGVGSSTVQDWIDRARRLR